MSSAEHFKRCLRLACIKKNITRKDLAAHLGCTVSVVHSIFFRGSPSRKNREKILDCFGMTEVEFLSLGDA